MIAGFFIKFLTLVDLGIRYRNRRNESLKRISDRKADFYSDSWRNAAEKMGANCEDLGSGFFQIRKGGTSIMVHEQYTPLVDRVTEKFLADKSISNRILSDLGTPVPRSLCLRSIDFAAAKSFLSEIAGPIVVKPAYGTAGGDGITTNVGSSVALMKAIAWSRAFSPSVILEEQIQGENYRVLLLEGEIVDIIVRRVPTVIGDGVSSIRELIRQENHERLYGEKLIAQNLIPGNLDTRNTLRAQGFGFRTVPAKGKKVAVGQVINCNRAEENESPKGLIATSTIEMAREIFRELGSPLLGIDIITPDISQDLGAAGGAVIEVNTPPGHFYHDLKKGGGTSIAARLLENAFSESERNKEPANCVGYQLAPK